MQLIVSDILAPVAIFGESSLKFGNVLKATKKKESESRANTGGFGRVN